MKANLFHVFLLAFASRYHQTCNDSQLFSQCLHFIPILSWQVVKIWCRCSLPIWINTKFKHRCTKSWANAKKLIENLIKKKIVLLFPFGIRPLLFGDGIMDLYHGLKVESWKKSEKLKKDDKVGKLHGLSW